MRKMLLPLAVVMVLLAASSAQATTLTIDQIIFQSGTGQDTSLISGTLDVTVTDNNTLTFILRNTSGDGAFTDATKPATMLLSGFGISSIGTITGGSVQVCSTALCGSDSVGVNFSGPAGTNISTEWGFVNASVDGYNGNLLVGNVVASQTQNPGQTNFSGTGNLDGPDYGLISANETQFGASRAGVNDAVVIVLDFSGTPFTDASATLAALEAGNVVLAFGSPDSVVPEPSALLLAGTALLGIGFSLRKRIFRGTKQELAVS